MSNLLGWVVPLGFFAGCALVTYDVCRRRRRRRPDERQNPMSRDPALDRAIHTLTAVEFLELAGLADLAAGQDAIRFDLAAALRRLKRIEIAITREGATMSEINDRLDQLTTTVADLADDVQRELADFAEAVSGKLDPEQRAKLDTLDQKLADIKAAIDTADPAEELEPEPEPETPGF